jgi:hypothetical protein
MSTDHDASDKATAENPFYVSQKKQWGGLFDSLVDSKPLQAGKGT